MLIMATGNIGLLLAEFGLTDRVPSPVRWVTTLGFVGQ
jgi:hypothetical protein